MIGTGNNITTTIYDNKWAKPHNIDNNGSGFSCVVLFCERYLDPHDISGTWRTGQYSFLTGTWDILPTEKENKSVPDKNVLYWMYPPEAIEKIVSGVW